MYYIMNNKVLFAPILIVTLLFIGLIKYYWTRSCYYKNKFDEQFIQKNNEQFTTSEPQIFDAIPHNAIFVGTARNVAPYLPKVLKNIDYLRSMFKTSEVVIYENDSTDNTLEILKNYDATIITENNVKGNRLQRLEHGRNSLIEHIERNDLDKIYDYMVVLDLDDVNEEICFQGFYNCFKIKDWDMFGANQTNFYYDTWALRTNNYNKNKNDFFPIVERLFYPQNVISMYIPNIKTDKEFNDYLLHPVISCFGGLGIYNIKKIRGCRYDSINGTDCEHVAFHKCIKSKYDAKIFINTKLINKGYT